MLIQFIFNILFEYVFSIKTLRVFTPNNLLSTVRSDCKKLGAAPIASRPGLKPAQSDSREQIYLKVIWCE